MISFSLNRARSSISAAAAVACIAFAVAMLARHFWLDWWARRGDEVRLAALADNPRIAENELAVNLAIARVAAIPPIEVAERSRVEEIDDVATDAEWNALTRTAFSLTATLKEPGLLAGHQLFRNANLNPRDIHIPAESRRGFSAWLEQGAPAVRHLAETIDRVAIDELQYMVARGVAPKVSYAEYVRTANDLEKATMEKDARDLREALRATGSSAAEIEATIRATKFIAGPRLFGDSFCHLIHHDSDDVHLGHLKHMPQARAAADAYLGMAASFYGQIVEFFRLHVGLTEEERSHLMDSIESAARKYRDPQ